MFKTPHLHHIAVGNVMKLLAIVRDFGRIRRAAHPQLDVASAETTIGREYKLCAATGVINITSVSGSTIEPPAESE